MTSQITSPCLEETALNVARAHADSAWDKEHEAWLAVDDEMTSIFAWQVVRAAAFAAQSSFDGKVRSISVLLDVPRSPA